MSASIGSASLILSANAEKLQAGLDGAYSKISSWKNQVSANVSKLNIGGLLGGAGLAALGGPLAIATGGMKLFGDAVASVKDLSAIGRQAKSLGVASGEFMGLGAAAKKAGLELPEFGNLLGKMTAKIAMGGEKTQMSLAGIGLSVGQIRGLNPADQFLAIADALSKTDDTGLQAAAAMGLFEDAGIRLLPTLQQGGDKLRAFVDAQKASGAALSNTDMATVQKAAAAIPKIEAAFTGLWNKVVVAMAPVIETIATVVGKVFEYVSPLIDWVGRAATAYFDVIGPVIAEVIDGIGEVVSAIAEWVGSLLGMAGEWPSVGEVITNVLRFIGKAGAYAFDVLKAGAGIVVIGLSLLVDAFGLVVSGIKNLLLLGAELPDSLGGSMFKEAAAAVQGFEDDVHGAAEKMREWGGNAIASFGESAAGVDKFFDKLKAKKKEVDAGLMDTGNILADIEEKQKKGKDDYKNAAVIKGSKEDYSVNAQIKIGAMQKAQGDKQLAVLGQIKDGIAKLNQQFDNMAPLATV